MEKDYYNVLGVTRNADKNEIKSAFRKLAHKYHPDKKNGDEKKFKEISEAYAVLSSEKRKAEYDTYGRVFTDGGQGGVGGFSGVDFAGANANAFNEFDLGDIFGEFTEFFGGGGRARRPKRGRDISIDVEISFHDAVFGTERKILLSKSSTCISCQGTGAKKGSEMLTCKSCNGKGKIYDTKNSILGTFTSVRLCDTCQGKGRTPKDRCMVCSGFGVSKGQGEINVVIPPGIDNGEMIRLGGEGEAIPGGTPGDLYIKVHVHPDPVFSKEGQNLIMTLPIKLSDALLGGKRTIRTLESREIEITIPIGVSSGQILRVVGKGVPLGNNNRGDLYIKIDIPLPKKLSRKARELIEDLREEGI